MKYAIFFFLLHSVICSQNSINIIESDKLEQTIINNHICQKLSGNVLIDYLKMKIKIDTAIIYQDNTLLNGWGNVHIYNDSIDVQSDSISVLRSEGKILFYNNVLFNTDTINIETNHIEYNYVDKIVIYNQGGQVQKNKNTITSEILIYNTNTEESQFINNVISTQSDYNIYSKNIITHHNIIYFKDSSTVKTKDYIMHFNDGYHDNNKNIDLFNNVTMIDDKQIIKADFFHRDIINNENIFRKNISININEELYIYGHKLIQNQNNSNISENCHIVLINKNDSIIIKGDTISINNKDDLLIINNVTIKGNSIDGKCNTMLFLNKKNIIEMRENPILWFTNTQLTGDNILLYNKSNQLDSIYVPANPFIISKVDSVNYYNQIKGTRLEGKIVDNRIQLLKIIGNAEMKFFQKYLKKEKIGLNDIVASIINIDFKENKIYHIKCTKDIDSNYSEFHINGAQIGHERLYIEGFKEQYIEQ